MRVLPLGEGPDCIGGRFMRSKKSKTFALTAFPTEQRSEKFDGSFNDVWIEDSRA